MKWESVKSVESDKIAAAFAPLETIAAPVATNAFFRALLSSVPFSVPS
jgi:hypothetical protein